MRRLGLFLLSASAITRGLPSFVVHIIDRVGAHGLKSSA
ncbi:hypothetical protein HDC35_000898 [Sphingopyxis sp. JAI128]|nr:hypothetical protein [Sphingopyxis sp. JAI128]